MSFIVQNMINVSVTFQKAVIRYRLQNIRKNKQCFALLDVAQRRLVVTDVLGQPIFPKQSKKMGGISDAETLCIKHQSSLYNVT